MLNKTRCLVWSMAICTIFVPAAQGADRKKFGIEIEAGPVWQSRNDVRIPNDTGTKFSMRDIQGSGPFAAARVYFDYAFRPKHEFRVLAAPLSVTATGRLPATTLFAGKTFAPGQPVEGTYQFNSYRLTYRYRIYEGDRWTWKIGATGKIRDAKIELRQGVVSAVDDNVGFVLSLPNSASRWNLLCPCEARARQVIPALVGAGSTGSSGDCPIERRGARPDITSQCEVA